MSDHGYRGYDSVVQVDGEDVGHWREITPELTAEMINTTSADTEGWKTRKQGVKDGSVSLRALWVPDDVARNRIEDAFFDGTNVTILWTDDEGNGWSQDMRVAKIGVGNVAAEATEGIEFPVDLVGDGAPTRLGHFS